MLSEQSARTARCCCEIPAACRSSRTPPTWAVPLALTMPTASGQPTGDNWDIRRLPADAGRVGQAVWSESLAARALGDALVASDGFWRDVDVVRCDPARLTEVARR